MNVLFQANSKPLCSHWYRTWLPHLHKNSTLAWNESQSRSGFLNSFSVKEISIGTLNVGAYATRDSGQMKPPTVSYKDWFCNYRYLLVLAFHNLFLFFQFPDSILMSSSSFLHLFFLPSFLFLSCLAPPWLSFHFHVHQVNLSLFTQCTKKQRDNIVYCEPYHLHCCMLTYILFVLQLLFYSFWSEIHWWHQSVDFSWLQVKTSSKASIKTSMQKKLFSSLTWLLCVGKLSKRLIVK